MGEWIQDQWRRVRAVPHFEPLLLICFAALGGVWCADWLAVPVGIWFWAAVGVAAAGLIASPKLGKSILWSQLFLCGLAALCFGGAHRIRLDHEVAFPYAEALVRGASPIRVTAEGVIRSEPQVFASGKTSRAVVKLASLTVNGRVFRVSHRVPVTLRTTETTALSYGDRVRFSAELMRTPPARNPGAFSPREFYRRNPGSHVQLVSGAGDRLLVEGRREGNPIVAFGLKSRHWLEEALTRGIATNHPEEASVLKAILLGAREDTPESVEEGFRLSGALHIFAVSGLHVGIFGGAIWILLRWTRVPLSVSLWIVIVAVLFYALVTGLRPPAVRAALMMSVVLLGLLTKRQARLFNSLAFAGLVILALDTHQMFQAGFQLSFAVLAAIVLLSPPLVEALKHFAPIEPLMPESLKSRLQLWLERLAIGISNSLAVSIAAMLGSLPIILYHFQLITPISLLTNLVVLLLAAGMIYLGIVSAAMAFLRLTVLAFPLNVVNAYLAKAAIAITGSLALVPGGHFYLSPFEDRHPPDVETCRVTILDTQDSGGAMLVEVAGLVVVIDTGSDFAYRQGLQPLLRKRGINRIDHLFLTHLDANHVGAAEEVLRRYQVDQVWAADLSDRTPTGRAILKVISDRRVPIHPLESGYRIQLAPRTAFRVFHPTTESAHYPRADDRAAILQLRHGERSILIAPDLGATAESLLEETVIGLESDVLVRGWHAEDYAGLEDFHEAVDPKLIITSESDGYDRVQIPESVRQWVLREDIPLIDLSGEATGAVTLTIHENGEMRVETFLGGPLEVSRRRH